MENAPVIHIVARTFKPEDEERTYAYYEKWFFEAFVPLMAEFKGFQGLGFYRIFREDTAYPRYLMVFHFENIHAFREYDRSQELVGIREALGKNFPGSDYSWFVQYLMVKEWGNEPAARTGSVIAPFIHFEGVNLKPEAEEAYRGWLGASGDRMYASLLAGGVRVVNIAIGRIIRSSTTHPAYLAVFHFPDRQAFTDWEKSPVMAAIRRNRPSPPSPVWYVQYELTKSWRK
jgi:antibiotic biosynthesis monooxygenase (ABM) superfamily enzyme